MSIVDPFEDIEQHAIEDAQKHDEYEQSRFFTDDAVASLTEEIDQKIINNLMSRLPKTPRQPKPSCHNIGRKGWYDPHRH